MGAEFQPPEVPGIYDGISMAAYQDGPGVSSGRLVKLLQAPPAYVQQDYERGIKVTDEMLFGSLVHCLALEPHLMMSQFAVAPQTFDGEPLNRRKQAHKAFLREWEASLPNGVEIVTDADVADARACVRALNAEPMFRALVKGAAVEQSFYWTDEKTGLLCRGRADAHKAGVISDIKVARDTTPEGFAKLAANRKYHLQAAYYCDGIAAATGGEAAAFVWIAIDRTYMIPEFYIASPAHLMLGRQECREALDIYAACQKSGKWPSATEGKLQTLQLPYWEARKLDLEDSDV